MRSLILEANKLDEEGGGAGKEDEVKKAKH